MSSLLAKLREQWSKGGCAVRAFILLVGFIALSCLCSVPITLMNSAGLIPTSTPTITPTSTPTATPSPTPFAVSLPQTVTTESGHIFTINKIETLDNIGDEQPDNGVFLVLLGILQATDESSGCAKSEHFSLTSGFDNSTTYEMDTDDLATAKRRYGYDYPGDFLGQCPDSTGEDSFIVFDIENSARNIWLRTAKSDVAIGDISLIVESKTIEITPTPTLPPTATPTPDAYYTVSISEISIFDEPNLEANKIGKVEQGKDFWVIASSQDSMWGKIISQDGAEGWISMDSLDDESSEFDSIPTVTNTPTTTPTPTETPTPLPTNTPTVAPSPTLQLTPSQEVLTIENNEDMAALFKVGDFDPFISEFAEKYSGRIIQFDGYIAHMMPHDGYETRFDLLIYTGNYGESSGNALSFKFEDINIVWDLKLTGPNIPEYISEGQNLRITAEVLEYKEASGLFFLEPVSTEIRP